MEEELTVVPKMLRKTIRINPKLSRNKEKQNSQIYQKQKMKGFHPEKAKFCHHYSWLSEVFIHGIERASGQQSFCS